MTHEDTGVRAAHDRLPENTASLASSRSMRTIDLPEIFWRTKDVIDLKPWEQLLLIRTKDDTWLAQR